MDPRSSAFSSKGSSRCQQNEKPAGRSTTKASGFAGKLTTDGQGSPKMTSSENNSDRGEYRENRIPQKWSPNARKKHLQNLTPAIPPEFWKNDPRTSPLAAACTQGRSWGAALSLRWTYAGNTLTGKLRRLIMPERRTVEKARKDKRAGKAPTTQAGEFIHEEIGKVRRGEHGARSPKQAIAIGL
jgi:hypothetical protein